MEKNSMIADIQARILEDDSFIREMVGTKDIEEMKEVLKKNGYALSDEEIEFLTKQGKEEIDAVLKEGELSEDELDAVAGGGKVRGTIRYIASLGIAAVGGFVIGATGGTMAPAGYLLAGVLTAWTLEGYAK